LSRTDWREFVQGLMAPDPGTRCQVCGEDPGELDMVGCVTCQTLHHFECWVYLGGCATYACGSREAEGPEGTENRLAEALAKLDLPHQHREAPKSDACDSCRRRWKGEKGVACDACGSTYHPACWVANGGCMKTKCRESAEAHEAPTLEELQGIVSGLGQGNCPVCTERPPPGERTLCSGCTRAYHRGCWRANSGCIQAECRPEAPPSGDFDDPEATLIPFASGFRRRSLPGSPRKEGGKPVEWGSQETKAGLVLTAGFLLLALIVAIFSGAF
jgi:hypothetical protein